MKRYTFNLKDGSSLSCLAPNFRAACKMFDQFKRAVRDIISIEERC